MTNALRLGLLLLVAGTLSACDSGSAPAANKSAGTAAGEILPHSIGDDMIAYDKVRSQAPLAQQADPDEKEGDAKSGDETDAPE
ncbi:MAG: hypothetical protein KDE55_15935 [Novosphingobium sp.]|nr:hypothetical protein [Novosphingobium sp.]